MRLTWAYSDNGYVNFVGFGLVMVVEPLSFFARHRSIEQAFAHGMCKQDLDVGLGRSCWEK